MLKLELAMVFGSIIVWLYSGREGAKQTALFLLVGTTLHLMIMFVIHRREWARLVLCRFSSFLITAWSSTLILLGSPQGFR